MDATVIKVLENATSQDPNVLKIAEQTLREWETQRGFYTALFNVFSNQSLPTNIRCIAILYFKNGVDRYWRRNAPNEIAADEKEFLRQGLIAKFDEPINQLAVQLAVLISKIARYDCPNEWITLFPKLLDVIRSNDNLAQHRALLTFHHVVKTLASKRLMSDRKVFQELTSNVYNFILNLWNTYTESFMLLVSNGASIDELQTCMEKALLSLRILGKLIMFGISKPSEDQNAMLFLKVIFERAKASLDCRKNLELRGIHLEACEKFIILLIKVLIRILDTHPYCYMELISVSLEFTTFYCFTDEGQSIAFEKFTVQCLILLHDILQFTRYKSIGELNEERHYVAKVKTHLTYEFFTPEILTEICNRLVLYYFVLTQSDLEMWDSDPENVGVDEVGKSWKYNLRSCTESIFVALVHKYESVFSKLLVQLLQKHHQPVDPNDLQSILEKDAVYNAVALAGDHLYNEVDFDQWFSTTLKEELKEKSNNYKIIRRRICELVGSWIGVKLSRNLRPELYSVIVQVLHPTEDLAVRLAASNALKLAINDCAFSMDDFAPFLETAFFLLFTLLKEVQSCDTKIRVLYVISFLIGRVDTEIKPHVGSFISYLSDLWHQSESYNMLRCAIVSTLATLVKVLCSDCIIIQPLIINVINLSCDMNQEEHVYLLEDGLELWNALLWNTPTPTVEIMNLFRHMPIILESSSENLKLCLSVISAYILLSPQDFISDLGHSITEVFRNLIGDMRAEGVIEMMKVLELCIRAVPQAGTEFIRPLLFKIFDNVYKGAGDLQEMELTMYLSIMARVLLNSRDIFAQVINELTKYVGQESEHKVFAKLIHIYVKHMPIVAENTRRKLLALALCSLISANSPDAVLQYFPQIMLNIVETLNDITKADDNGCPVDSFMIYNIHNGSESEATEIYETQQMPRKMKLDCSDPVYCVALDEVLQNQIITLRKEVGDKQYTAMMQTLDAEVDQQIREYVKI